MSSSIFPRTMAAADGKKPMTAYFMWLNDNRPKIVKEHKLEGKKGSEVTKKAGEVWKILSAKDKAPYEQRAKEAKEKYEKFMTTDEGKAAKAAKAEERGTKRKGCPDAPAMSEEERKKLEELSSKLKKPVSAYWIWLGENREKIAKEHKLDSKKVAEVSKKAGEVWKGLLEKDKAPYEKKASAQKEEFEKFVKTDEGKKALEAKKALSKQKKAEKKAKKAKKAAKNGDNDKEEEEDEADEDEDNEDEEDEE